MNCDRLREFPIADTLIEHTTVCTRPGPLVPGTLCIKFWNLFVASGKGATPLTGREAQPEAAAAELPGILELAPGPRG